VKKTVREAREKQEPIRFKETSKSEPHEQGNQNASTGKHAQIDKFAERLPKQFHLEAHQSSRKARCCLLLPESASATPGCSMMQDHTTIKSDGSITRAELAACPDSLSRQIQPDQLRLSGHPQHSEAKVLQHSINRRMSQPSNCQMAHMLIVGQKHQASHRHSRPKQEFLIWPQENRMIKEQSETELTIFSFNISVKTACVHPCLDPFLSPSLSPQLPMQETVCRHLPQHHTNPQG
jgi:hypothetical protein